MYRYAVTAILLLLTVGCASTKMQSLMDNPGAHRYTKILLFVPISNLIIRHNIETAIMKEFNKIKSVKRYAFSGPGVYTQYKLFYAFAWMDNDTLAAVDSVLYSCTQISPLWDELSPYELDSILTPFGFDATLVVTPEAYWTTSTYIPKHVSYDIDLRSTKAGRDITTSGAIKERTVGGYTVTIPHWQFDSRIYGFENEKLLWKATSVSSGSIFDKNLPKSYAKELIEKLQADQIIPRRTQITDLKGSR